MTALSARVLEGFEADVATAAGVAYSTLTAGP